MKNIILKSILVFSLILTFIACGEDDTNPRITAIAQSNAKVLNPISGNYVISESILPNIFNTFVVDKANYGQPIALNYQFEIAKKGTDFSKVANVGPTFKSSYKEVTFKEINDAIIGGLELEPNVAEVFQIRLKTFAENSYIEPSYSNLFEVTITPFKVNPDDVFPKINVPGGYAGAAGYANWAPNNSPNLFSFAKNDIYTGFVYFNDNNQEYKFTIKEDWAGDKGDDNTFTGKLIETDEKNCKMADAGAYYIKVDWANNTYSTQKANFGIIGDATPGGWDADTNLTYNPASKKFEIANIALVGGKAFKFRANDAWDIKILPNAGADVTVTPNKEVQVYSSIDGFGGADKNFIISESGNYKVELDLHNSGYYSMKFIKL